MTGAHHDDEGRDRVRVELDTSLVVVAGAGTGKTTALVGRVVELVLSGKASIGEIAAITFTEAAAAELRQRVRDRLEAEVLTHPGASRPAAALHEVDEAAIGTLHAFARRILVEHGVAAGIPPGFDVLDETAERADFEARFERFADVLLSDAGAEDALVRGFSVGLTRDDLTDLAWSLHRHCDRLEDGGLEALERMRPVPGRWPAAGPEPVLGAIDNALSMGGWCTDPEDLLKDHLDSTLAGVRARLASCDDVASTLQFLDSLKPLRCTLGQQGNWSDHVDEVRAACAAAEQARQDILRATRHAVLAEIGARLAVFVMTAANERRAAGRLGFHDLLVQTRRLLRHHGEATQSLRRRYRYLLIDEFQDTDPIQVELAARIAATVEGSADVRHARPGGLFVVGDPKQSIYRFRRADIESFEAVARQIGEPIVLATNFRSVPGVLDFVNTVSGELFGAEPVPGQAAHHHLYGARHPLPLRWTGSPATRGHALPGGPGPRAVQLSLDGLGPPATASSEPGPGRPGRPGVPGMPPVVVLGGPSRAPTGEIRRAAARDVAAAVAGVVGNRWAVIDSTDGAARAARWRDVAVLLPARSTLAALEEALEDARVPYRLEGLSMLWDSDEVRDVLAVLHAADDPDDHVAVVAALRSPGLACGDDDLLAWRQAGGAFDVDAPPPTGMGAHPVALAMAVLVRLHDQRWWCEPSALVARAFDELHSFELCTAHHRPRDHWHRLRWLQDQARLFDETVGGPLRTFLRWADLQAEDDRHSGGVGPPDPDDDAVRVMTIHGAKGLEFPVVVLAGLERDMGGGPRPPAVLWREDGTPELRGRRELKSEGYDLAGERERELEASERHRLLYVGMTRARDHLVMSLHHREPKENSTTVPTEAARVHDICLRHPDLWSRLPVADLVGARAGDRPVESGPGGTGPGGAGPKRNGPERNGPAEGGDGDGDGDGDDAMATWQARLADFEARRGRTLDAGRGAPVTTATAVAEHIDDDRNASSVADHPGTGGRGRGPDPGSPDWTGVPWQEAEVSLQVGRAVHAALAAVDPSTGADARGTPADEVARIRAVAHGVALHADAVTAMVGAALRAPIVTVAATRRHWRELFVAMPVGDGGVLEGYVDLVVEDGDGLVAVDYKTDRVDGPAAVAAAASRYGPQVASYALALEEATGREVRRCVLVFVGGGDPVEHVLDGAELSTARAEALQAARDLVAVR